MARACGLHRASMVNLAAAAATLTGDGKRTAEAMRCRASAARRESQRVQCHLGEERRRTAHSCFVDGDD